jgi:hypothetical protein
MLAVGALVGGLAGGLTHKIDEPSSSLNQQSGDAAISIGEEFRGGGFTWTAVLGDDEDWQAVAASSDGSKVYAGYDDGVKISSDGGRTWQEAEGLDNSNIVSISTNSAGTCVAAGSTDDIVFVMTPSTGGKFVAHEFDTASSLVTMAEDCGRVLLTAKASGTGETGMYGLNSIVSALNVATGTLDDLWSTPQRGYANIRCEDASCKGTILLMAGFELLKSTDGGATLTSTPMWASPETQGGAVDMCTDETMTNILVVFNRARGDSFPYLSRDAGKTFTKLDIAATWRACGMSKNGQIVVMGTDEALYVNHADESTRFEQFELDGNDIRSIFIADGSNTIFVATDDAVYSTR